MLVEVTITVKRQKTSIIQIDMENKLEDNTIFVCLQVNLCFCEFDFEYLWVRGLTFGKQLKNTNSGQCYKHFWTPSLGV